MGGFVGDRGVRRAMGGVLVLLAACSTGQDVPTPAPSPGTIIVASFDFPESELLAEVYARALEAKGFRVGRALQLGPRELVQPALQRGLVQVVPEYAGSALAFLGQGDRASRDPGRTHAALEAALADTAVVPLARASAQNANAFAVTASTARRYELTAISDLAPVASNLVLGGPPECTDRRLCLVGLREVYGLRFRRFVPLDAGGPLTRSALAGGEVDVALLFTTDPSVGDRGFVLLRDDRGLEPAENVTPVVSRDVLQRYGARLRSAIDAVSGQLTTDDLVAKNRALAERTPGQVAASWLEREGLA